MVDMTDGSGQKFEPKDEDHATGKAAAVDRFGAPVPVETEMDRRQRETAGRGELVNFGTGVGGAGVLVAPGASTAPAPAAPPAPAPAAAPAAAPAGAAAPTSRPIDTSSESNSR